MKSIKYKFLSSRVNHGTEENPAFEDVILEKGIICAEADLEANLAIAAKEALNGEYTIEDDGEPEPPEVGDTVTWDELDAAYQEGVDSV